LGEPVAEGVAFVAGAFAGDEGIPDGVVEPIAEGFGGRFVEVRGPFVEDVDAGELLGSAAFGIEFDKEIARRLVVAGEGEESELSFHLRTRLAGLGGCAPFKYSFQ